MSLVLSERIACTYCGREGHHASHCPWSKTEARMKLTESDFTPVLAPHAGLTYQGRYHEAAEAATDIGADDQREPLTTAGAVLMIAIYTCSVIAVIAIGSAAYRVFGWLFV